MSHFNVCVLVTRDNSKSLEEMAEIASNKLNNFSINRDGAVEDDPNSHMDYWSIIDEVTPENRRRLLLGEGGEHMLVRAIVTPNDEWVDGPWFYGGPDPEQTKQLKIWEDTIDKIFEEHRDVVAFLFDCHI